jgi:CMP-N,N'-diacetyllegionaminic acid synthase
MYQGKRILAVIPARNGSKGIVRKNIKPLAGEPLIVRTILEANKSSYIDLLVTSTDSKEIAHVARKGGSDVPFLRPKELGQDDSMSIDVVLDVIAKLPEDYDYLLLLQPTSPFRTSVHIDSIIQDTLNREAKFAMSVTEVKKHPAFFYQHNDEGLERYLPYLAQKRRQEMEPLYEPNGALYFASIKHLKLSKTFSFNECYGYKMSHKDSLDLDSYDDWEFCEYILSK